MSGIGETMTMTASTKALFRRGAGKRISGAATFLGRAIRPAPVGNATSIMSAKSRDSVLRLKTTPLTRTRMNACVNSGSAPSWMPNPKKSPRCWSLAHGAKQNAVWWHQETDRQSRGFALLHLSEQSLTAR